MASILKNVVKNIYHRRVTSGHSLDQARTNVRACFG